MEEPIKIEINKLKNITGNFSRYYPAKKMVNGKWVTGGLIINDDSTIKTESQLTKYLLTIFHPGHYQLIGHQRGQKGFILFWIGDIETNRYRRAKFRKNKEGREVEINWQDGAIFSKTSEKILKDFGISESDDDYAERIERIGEIRAKVLKNFHGWGFNGTLLPVLPVGQWHSYDVQPNNDEEKIEEEDFTNEKEKGEDFSIW